MSEIIRVGSVASTLDQRKMGAAGNRRAGEIRGVKYCIDLCEAMFKNNPCLHQKEVLSVLIQTLCEHIGRVEDELLTIALKNGAVEMFNPNDCELIN
jgi:hypothetical protein